MIADSIELGMELSWYNATKTKQERYSNNLKEGHYDAKQTQIPRTHPSLPV